MKGVQCSETNAESNFRFLQILVLEIWPILYSKFLMNWGDLDDCVLRLFENLIQKR